MLAGKKHRARWRQGVVIKEIAGIVKNRPTNVSSELKT